jgi:hypothetical protein
MSLLELVDMLPYWVCAFCTANADDLFGDAGDISSDSSNEEDGKEKERDAEDEVTSSTMLFYFSDKLVWLA